MSVDFPDTDDAPLPDWSWVMILPTGRTVVLSGRLVPAGTGRVDDERKGDEL